MQDNASPIESETPLPRDRQARDRQGSRNTGRCNTGRFRGRFQQLLALALFALAFFLAPALLGINLVAEQSSRASQSTRAADKAASDEAQRLIARSL